MRSDGRRPSWQSWKRHQTSWHLDQVNYPSLSQRSILIFFGHRTRKLKPNELHGVLDELLNFFDAPSQILSDEQEARATIVIFQSLLSSDTLDDDDDDKSDVKVYSNVANRLSEWTKTFLT